MPNETAKAAVLGFQQKLDTFKTKIQFQQLLAQSLAEEFEALTSEFESLKQVFDVSLLNFESTSPGFGVTSADFGSTSIGNESSSPKIDGTSEKFGVTSTGFGSSSLNDGALSTVRELAALIRRAAGESLKIYYSQPNIPGRMAQIVLALKERKRLSVVEMMQLTGASRNSLGRDISVLKQMGWLEFHGSRKNGYFTLTAKFPGLQIS